MDEIKYSRGKWVREGWRLRRYLADCAGDISVGAAGTRDMNVLWIINASSCIRSSISRRQNSRPKLRTSPMAASTGLKIKLKGT